MSRNDSLLPLGWRTHFQVQVDETEDFEAARIAAVHRNRVDAVGTEGTQSLDLGGRSREMGLTVGDWVLLDSSAGDIVRRLDPFGVFQRRAAGTTGDIQRIAANVDTLFVVTSANRDFNVARLERYLAVAHDAGAYPIIVITKADTVDTVDEFLKVARSVSPGIVVEALDARDAEQVSVLRDWCSSGQTVALVGSSGVGKSTLINTLTGADQQTSATREDDQRGRHTTTQRSMHALPDGGWLIDTPGMRELQLVDVGDSLNDVFADIANLAERCRFQDCEHNAEPGCKVQEAIDNGRLDVDRLRRYRKLQAENRRNSESMAERRSRDKHLGKLYKVVQSETRHRKEGK
ncbi:MAG TPA: ribosome small subunit-dependent GTPase A [Woeseiaceae bacterium]|nr:ribosome small subunit-dependent GTPase A [Woeseiaceae bacterium]